jgi:hypothetical protein
MLLKDLPKSISYNMEHNSFSARFRDLNNNPWVSFFSLYTPAWKTLIHMLRPMDIVALAEATQFRLRPSNDEIQTCMKWWRQIFYDMRWVEQNGSNVTVIGKDLVRLNYALERWNYFNTDEMKLLLVVKSLPAGIARDEGREALILSTDATYVWNYDTHEIPHFDFDTQICVLFLSQNIYVDLAFTWSRDLLEQIRAIPPLHHQGIAYYQNVDQRTISPLPDIDPLPAGLRILGLDRDPVSDPWFRAWQVNLRLPNFMINATITRADLTIYLAPNFNYRESGIRLAIADDGSVVIPTIPEHILFIRSRNPQWSALPGLGW